LLDQPQLLHQPGPGVVGSGLVTDGGAGDRVRFAERPEEGRQRDELTASGSFGGGHSETPPLRLDDRLVHQGALPGPLAAFDDQGPPFAPFRAVEETEDLLQFSAPSVESIRHRVPLSSAVVVLGMTFAKFG
jgi:hypothetical protein